MKFLLDTHIWLWSHREPRKLSSAVAQMIEDPSSELWLSPVSIWELIILLEKKRVSLREDVVQWIEKSKRSLDLHEAPFSWQVAGEIRSTVLSHQDPADRFLVATAKAYELTLVTADSRLWDIPGVAVLANR